MADDGTPDPTPDTAGAPASGPSPDPAAAPHGAEAGSVTAPGERKVFGTWRLALFSFIFIASINSVPALASYGLSSITFYAIAIVFLLLPTALVSSELGASLPATGGIYVWTRTALGDRLGFLVIWLEWAAQVIAMPVIMTTIATQVAYGFDPALANDSRFMFVVVLTTIWAMTAIASRGLKVARKLNLVAVVAGNFVPAVILVGLAVLWLAQGRGTQMTISASAIIPTWNGFPTIVFASTTFLMFAGIEIAGIHAGDVRNPTRTMPRANAITAVLCILLFVPATLAIAIVIPSASESVVAGIMQAVRVIFPAYDISWLIPVFALLIASGLALAVMQMLGGPARGVMVAAREGNLPPFFQRENKHGVPMRIVLVQACVASVLASLFVLMPSVQNAWWALAATQTQLTLLIYVIMYASLRRLRATRPDLPRPYRIPGGRVGLGVVTIGGTLACLAVIAINFVPPSQLDSVSFPLYAGAMVLGVVTVCGLPFLARAFRRPTWTHDEHRTTAPVADGPDRDPGDDDGFGGLAVAGADA